MKLPVKMPARSSSSVTIARPNPTEGLTPAGCCARVCAPVVGCHCVAESPFC